MSDSAALQRDLDAVATRGRHHLYGWGVLQSLRNTLGPALMLLPCVPMLWVSWQVIGWFEPTFAPAPGVGIAALLTVCLPLFYAAARMYSALLGRDIERFTALAVVDRQLDNRDRLTTAQEFLSKPSRTGFEQAALGSAEEHIQQALRAELEPVSKPAMNVSRRSLACVVVAVVLWLLGSWLGTVVQPMRSGDSRSDIERMIADAALTDPPRSPRRIASATSPDERSDAQGPRNHRAQREQSEGEQTGDRGAGAASGGSEVGSADSSRNASAASGGAGSQDNASSQTLSAGSASDAAASATRTQSDAGSSGSAGTGASANAAGGESGGSTDAGATAGNNGSQSSGQANGEGDAGESSSPGTEGAGGGGGEVPGAASSGVSDGAGPHLTGGLKRSRGVASMILGLPIEDRVAGLANAGRTRVTRTETSPTPEAAALVDAQDRGARSSAVGPLAQPQLTAWMRQVVEQYFDASGDPRVRSQTQQ